VFVHDPEARNARKPLGSRLEASIHVRVSVHPRGPPHAGYFVGKRAPTRPRGLRGVPLQAKTRCVVAMTVTS
jgi:hypothetical protein